MKPRTSSRAFNACRPLCFAQYETALGNADGLRFHDLVRGPLLQKTVLMDARFMREGIASTMALLGCGPKLMIELSSWLAGKRCSLWMPVVKG